MACLTLTILLLLPGYKQQAENGYFPAPLASPTISFYANISNSGLYDKGRTNPETISNISAGIKKICTSRGTPEAEINKIASSTEIILHERILSGIIKPYEMFFYFQNAQNFAVILGGEFARDKIADFIGKDKVKVMPEGFSTLIRRSADEQDTMHLEIRNDMLVLCPENIAGNILENINLQKNLLSDDLKAFSKMVTARPALAVEINFEALQNNSSKDALPVWLKPLKHLRLIAADRMTKIQMYVPDGTARETLSAKARAALPGIENAIGNIASFSLALKGNSIFIEAPAEKRLEQAISRQAAAFILHFFVRAHENIQEESSRTNG